MSCQQNLPSPDWTAKETTKKSEDLVFKMKMSYVWKYQRLENGSVRCFKICEVWKYECQMFENVWVLKMKVSDVWKYLRFENKVSVVWKNLMFENRKVWCLQLPDVWKWKCQRKGSSVFLRHFHVSRDIRGKISLACTWHLSLLYVLTKKNNHLQNLCRCLNNLSH